MILNPGLYKLHGLLNEEENTIFGTVVSNKAGFGLFKLTLGWLVSLRCVGLDFVIYTIDVAAGETMPAKPEHKSSRGPCPIACSLRNLKASTIHPYQIQASQIMGTGTGF